MGMSVNLIDLGYQTNLELKK